MLLSFTLTFNQPVTFFLYARVSVSVNEFVQYQICFFLDYLIEATRVWCFICGKCFKYTLFSLMVTGLFIYILFFQLVNYDFKKATISSSFHINWHKIVHNIILLSVPLMQFLKLPFLFLIKFKKSFIMTTLANGLFMSFYKEPTFISSIAYFLYH